MPKENQMKKFNQIADKVNDEGKIVQYEDDYLLEPIQLEVKLEQFDPA